MPTRREFVTSFGAATIGVGTSWYHSLLPTPRSPGRLGPLGVQLYTVREEMRRDIERTLARVAEIGYREVEFAGYFGRTPRQVRAMLDANHLVAPGAHVGLDTLEGDAAERTIEAARVIGHDYLIVAWTPAAWRRSLDDWRRVAERFNRAGERTRAAGIQFAYHNHDFEFRELEGRVPFDVLCEATDPRLVRIELDLFWIVHGGGDPLAFLRRWPGRVPLVHVKDRTADGRMMDVGAGVIDWRGIFARRRQAGIRHFFVEHDEPADPWASIRASYGYLSGLRV
ncbi:MAG: sugar phosphate isomerase/epimerase [Gemmatimonadales bacterium]|nr:sugar phosphate isomerase/epimerase [Gemmatimonadales bacterium]